MKNNSPYANLTPKDFDQYNCVKVSLGLYIILAFLLRGYIVWAMSVTNLQDRVGFLSWIYPEKFLFYLSLLSGIIGWFIVIVLSLRRPDAPAWVVASWRYCFWILLIALTFDFLCTLWGFIFAHRITSSTLIIHATIVLLCVIYITKNQRLRLNFKEFPEAF